MTATATAVATTLATERLRAHIARRGSLARASVMFGRTEDALRAHAASLGLKFPTISELRKRAKGSEHVPQVSGSPRLQ
jgi:formate-dependent phosphoribosylglycinamide formyltransferase (GAR transformylase)